MFKNRPEHCYDDLDFEHGLKDGREVMVCVRGRVLRGDSYSPTPYFDCLYNPTPYLDWLAIEVLDSEGEIIPQESLGADYAVIEQRAIDLLFDKEMEKEAEAS